MAATEFLHSGGRRWINQVLNKAVSLPTNMYIGLRTLDGVSGHPADAAAADTLTSNLQEVSGGGYARIAVTLNTTNMVEAASGADSTFTVAQQTFSFTGTIVGITHSFLATTSDNTGVLIASAPLSVTRNVINGDTIKETFVFTMTGA